MSRKRKQALCKLKYVSKKKEIGKYRTEQGKTKEIEEYRIHISSEQCDDICNIYIYDIKTKEKDGTYFIEYPKNEIRVEYENTTNDDYSVFITKSYYSKNYEKNLLEVGITVYKRENFASNKKIYAVGAIKIDKEGSIKYEYN